MNLNDLEESKTSRVLIFGAPKTGKTELVGKLASDFKLIWFDLENGYETLLKLPKEFKERITLIRLRDTRSYPIAIETLLKVVKGGEKVICDEHGKVDCVSCKLKAKEENSNVTFTTVNLTTLPKDTIVVFDSLTQLTNSAIANITKKEADDYKMQFDDWGNLGKLMDIFLSHIQQADYNVVCISHESEVEYEDGKKKIVPVSGTRNFSRNTAKYFDHVIYSEVKNKKHVFGSATDYSMSIVTGSRTDIAIEKLTEPSLLPIFKHDFKQAITNQDSQGTKSLLNIGNKLNQLKKEGN